MRFRFTDKKLEQLYTGQRAKHKFHYPDEVIKKFFTVMAFIKEAENSQDLRSMTGLRFEKLRGTRTGQHSLRLNKQWRLVVALEEDAQGNIMVIIEIVDYH